MKRLLLLLSLFLSTSLISCSEDTPVEPEDPNKNRRSVINAFYAHPGQVLPAYFSSQDSVTISALMYGQRGTGLAHVGNKKIRIQDQSNAEIATSDEVTIDSTRSVWIVYSGQATSNEALAFSTPKISGIANTLAGIRFIHASKNAPKVNLHLEVAQGSAVYQSFTEYGRSSSQFIPININTTALVAVNESGTGLVTLPMTTPLEGGKLYTVVLYGNADQSATANRLTAAIFQEQ